MGAVYYLLPSGTLNGVLLLTGAPGWHHRGRQAKARHANPSDAFQVTAARCPCSWPLRLLLGQHSRIFASMVPESPFAPR